MKLNKKSSILTIAFFIWGFFLTACGKDHQAYRFYPGSSLAQNEIAVIRGYDYYREKSLINSRLTVVAINGKEIPSTNGASRVEVLPGDYELKVYYLLPDGKVDYSAQGLIKLHAQKGQSYILGVKCNLKTRKMIFFYDIIQSSADNDKQKTERTYDPAGVKPLTLLTQELERSIPDSVGISGGYDR